MPETVGRYELIARIGRGGMADVLLARDGTRLVVLKILLDELATDPATVQMMRDEAQIASKIEHANVVDVFECGEADGQYYIAMEYLEGESLLSVLDKGITGKPLDALSMTRIVADTAKGLAAAHAQGVVHHDISLGNIFVLYSGAVKLLDFGVARDAKAEPAKLFGKLAYTAPEKLDAKLEAKTGGARSDIWSLGCVLWEALTNKRLFKGANDIEIVREVRYINVPPPSSVRREVPPALDAITLRCLQREPVRRYASAGELASALEDVLDAQGYPPKNYKIGTYMMQAFADVIAARERLLRESAGASRPSAEVIDAAFSPTTTRDSLPVLERAPDLMSTDGEVFEIAGAPAPVSAAVAIHEPEPEPIELEPEPEPAPAPPPPPRRAFEMRGKRFVPLAFGGALVAAVVMIVAIRSCVGEDKLPPPPPPPPLARPAVLAPDAATIALAPPVPVDAAAPAAEPEAIEMPPEDAKRDEPKPEPKPRAKPAKSAQKYYAEGLAAWKKNDLEAAAALFGAGRRANATYANNWYGLGLVHDKAGRKREARLAFERYMKLAPKSPLNAKLRDHIRKKLL